MNFSFALYETLRRLVLLGLVVSAIGFLLLPDEDPLDLENSVAANEPAASAAAIEPEAIAEPEARPEAGVVL